MGCEGFKNAYAENAQAVNSHAEKSHSEMSTNRQFVLFIYYNLQIFLRYIDDMYSGSLTLGRN